MSLSSDALYRLQRARSSWASAAAGWAEQRAVGSSAVSRVCSTRGAALERVERPWETEGAPDDDGYPTSLAEPCRRLAAAADSLHEQLERLQAATDTLTALGRLEEARAGRGDSTAGAAPAVTTWDASRCAAAASRLLPLYTKETEVKRTVASWLAHADSAAALTALRAAWMHHSAFDGAYLPLGEDENDARCRLETCVHDGTAGLAGCVAEDLADHVFTKRMDGSRDLSF
ncbi:hypothetical protein FJT64_011043 [Amphibalanus amphitrite]|uniref:Uncharacterized protein n=1 Tax=Amphibalanus amphitrite TaxID=1232801 RepID=A0A6A4VJV6_AMPAM|nr:hypothetical protein FJT64_011043 [Amphibalanus amphitrite]